MALQTNRFDYLACSKRVLPLLMQPLLAGGTDWRFWSFNELAERTLYSVERIRATLLELERRCEASLEMYSNGVRLLRAPQIDPAIAFRPDAAPSTPFAKAFREHGVRLTKSLRPSTAWCQRSEETGEVVLTLDTSAINTNAQGVEIYDCSKQLYPETDWEALPGSAPRLDLLRKAFKDEENVRIIRVTLEKDAEGTYRITKQSVDTRYWRIRTLDEAGRRFSAEKTEQDAPIYPLAFTA